VPLLLLLVGAGAWIWNRYGNAARVAVGVAALLVFSVSAVGQVRTVTELKKGGQGYASFKWYDSKVMEYIRTLQPGMVIYTNEPGAVYLYTGRGCRVLPEHVDPVTGLACDNFDVGVRRIHEDVLSGRAMLVLFSDAFVAPEIQADYDRFTAGLYLVMKSGGDAVYYAPPP